MTNEEDLIFDDLYEEYEPVLVDALDESIDFMIEEGVSLTNIEKILFVWFERSGSKEQFVAKNAERLIKESK